MKRATVLVALLIIPAVLFPGTLKGIEDNGRNPEDSSSTESSTSTPSPESMETRKSSGVEGNRIERILGRLPLYFIENQGQMDREVRFYIQGSDKTLYFTPTGITFALTSGEGSSSDPFNPTGTGRHHAIEGERWVFRLDFLGAGSVIPRGEEKQEAIFSYFKGSPDHWKTGISSYARIVYENLWPGIDLVYSGTANRLKYEFVVSPEADPESIRLSYSGVSGLSVDADGRLIVTTPLGNMDDEKPFAYQRKGSVQEEVSISYRADPEQVDGIFSYRFELGQYDPEKTLILDPALLVYCGYIGGEDSDGGQAIAVDDQGHAYVTGITPSSESMGFPVTIGPDLTYNGGDVDVYVAKVDAYGNSLVYCGYIGGSNGEWAYGIAVDKQGNAYVTGDTFSTEKTGFPVKVGPDLTLSGQYDAFVAKVNASGAFLDYCGYIGGKLADRCHAIAVDSQGNAFVAGGTSSSENYDFPVKVGPDLTFNGYLSSHDAFVAKVNASGAFLDYCGYIGGYDLETAHGVAVDGQGSAYVTGTTASDENNGFPVNGGPDLTFNGRTGDFDAFVAKVNASGAYLDYCGYIGGSEREWSEAIAVDGRNNAYVTGWTESREIDGFPVSSGPDLTHNGATDVYLAKVSADGGSLIFCGYIGGVNVDCPGGIAVDSLGNAYLTGWTSSSEREGFPVKDGPDLDLNGEWDAFVTKVNSSGLFLEYCGYIGGDDWDFGRGIALDKAGNAYVAGNTFSSEAEGFPAKGGPDLTFNGGKTDGFVAMISTALTADRYDLSARKGGAIDFALSANYENAGRNYILLGSHQGTTPGITLPGGQTVLPLTFDYFTAYILQFLNSSLFQNFSGVLDAKGSGSALLNSTNMTPLPPGVIGSHLYFAYALHYPWDFVSNPVEIEIVP